MIRVSELSKRYGAFEAVRDLSFEVRAGEILGLLGPNGAGKTTTLRMIAGILPPSSGTVLLGGCDVERDPVRAKANLAFIPDMPEPFEDLSVWEHLRFYASVFGVRGVEAKAAPLLRRFGLEDRRHLRGSELSRGMKQKLSLCCAYLHDPKAILLDEPLTGLDPFGIRTAVDSIAERAAAGAAIIVSSHLMDLVERVCTRILVIHRGEAVLHGSIEEVRARVAAERGGSLESLFLKLTGEAEPAP